MIDILIYNLNVKHSDTSSWKKNKCLPLLFFQQIRPRRPRRSSRFDSCHSRRPTRRALPAHAQQRRRPDTAPIVHTAPLPTVSPGAQTLVLPAGKVLLSDNCHTRKPTPNVSVNVEILNSGRSINRTDI